MIRTLLSLQPFAVHRRFLSLALVLLAGAPVLVAEALPPVAPQPSSSSVPDASLPDAPAPQVSDRSAVTIRNTPVHVLKDLGAVATSPVRIRTHDLIWLAPLAGAEAAAIATDDYTMTHVVSHNPGFNNANVNASNIIIGGFIATPVVLYGYGHFEDSAHARESGVLSGEAMIDSIVAEQALKLIFWRERPGTDGGRGRFFQGSSGVDTSFPSSHSMVAFSAAAVIANEYPKPWVETTAYSIATGVCLTRVMGQQHFPGDVLAGAAAGWLIGHYVFRAHHHPAVQ
ncbi:MAG TPA: phosphatase PAP2 family protein [Acidobacteriaceae bacterium]|nr:phosphatase PAP2 family protein [Acidobacteriaceae bacterium]